MTARNWLEGFAQTDFDRGEIVVAATDGQAAGRNHRVGTGEEIDDFFGRHRHLVIERCEFRWNCDRVNGFAGKREECVGREAGAGAVRAPLVAEQTRIGIEVGVLGGIARPRRFGTVLGIASGGPLRPKTVENERRVLGALGGIGVRVAELR